MSKVKVESKRVSLKTSATAWRKERFHRAELKHCLKSQQPEISVLESFRNGREKERPTSHLLRGTELVTKPERRGVKEALVQAGDVE